MHSHRSLWQSVRLLSLQEKNLTILEDAAIVVEAGRIAWMGVANALPQQYQSITLCHNGKNALVTPGLIDCHTHCVFGGNRAQEFALRLEGHSYQSIAKQGGGIQSTVRATHQATEQSLYAAAYPRVLRMRNRGVTTLEIKSGYGLDEETERKILKVAQRLAADTGLNIQKTFLGAHAVPTGMQKTDYLDSVLVCLSKLHAEGLVDAVDAFCESIAFSPAELKPIFDLAKQLGLPIKLHAEQLSNQHSAAFAAKYQALSADHLEHLDEAGVQAMAQAGTVAVLLPVAFYMLGDTHKPPIDLLRRYQVPIALATDCNPGTSPCDNLTLAMHLGCTLFGLTPLEALLGVTYHAALALGLSDRLGTLTIGKQADFVLWSVTDPIELFYWFGEAPCQQVVKAGRILK